MRLLDEQYTRTPFYGSRRMVIALGEQGWDVNRKRVRRLMQQMGIEAIYPKPRLSDPAPGHRIYPYRLRGLAITRPNQVWSTDITYIRLRSGFVYLVAILDWFSRYVVDWEISITLDPSFCLSTLDRALEKAKPAVLEQAVERTAGATVAYLHRKALPKPMVREVEERCASLGVRIVREGDLAIEPEDETS